MASFEKNNNQAVTEKHNERDKPLFSGDDEIADVLLTEKNKPFVSVFAKPGSSENGEVVYDLLDEEEKDNLNSEKKYTKQTSQVTSLNDQVAKLCQEYEMINQRLEKSLIATDELSKQLAQSKKVVSASYAALGVAAFACLLGIGAIMSAISMQRGIDDLENSFAIQAKQIVLAKQEAVLKNQALAGQITQLNEKVETVFANSSLDSVLQVTQELKKQVNALANKNLAAMASRGYLENTPPKQSKVSLPSLKLEQAPQQTATAIKANTEKEAQNDRLPALADGDIVQLKQKKHRWHRISKKPKEQSHTVPVEKPAKPSSPKLPTLD